MAKLYEDLLKDTSESFEDGNYFLLTITELELGTTYPLEFRWKYKDGTYGKDWSAVYNITTPVSSVPGDPNLAAGDVVGGPGYIKVTWNGNDASGNPIENIDRVNVHIAGASFGDGTKPAGFFKTAGTQTFTAEPGIYIVQLKAVRVDGATSFFSTARTVTVTAIEEAIETPVVPNGFTARAILSGIEVAWAGTYVGGATWSGFQAINIYAGTSSSATGGTYIKVGQMTANKVSNKIVIPIDGTYVRYGFPAYIHASSVNKATPPVESSISANVASATPSQVVNTDLIEEAVTATKIALGAVTNTKIADDAITTPKILAGSITTGKIDSLAITSDKIAALAITAGKIESNAITADLINSGTLKATTYIRVGTKNLSTGAGGRIEISSALIEDGTYDIPAGLYIYNSAGTAVLEAPLGGGLTITGGGTFTGNLLVGTGDSTFGSDSNGIWLGRSTFAAASDRFRVSRSGAMTAASGTIGGITISAAALQNNPVESSSTFQLDSSGKARFGAYGGNSIIIDPSIGIFQSTNGTSANGRFTLNATGDSTISGWTIGTNSISRGATNLYTTETDGFLQIGTASPNFIKIGSQGIQLGHSTFNSAPFRVTPAGAVTASNLTITGGSINLNSGVFAVSSAGELTATSATITGTVNATGGTFSGNIAASGTISGGRIRTAESGDRIELNDPSYLNEISLYAGATFPGRIYGFTSGSNGQLRIRSPYASGSSIAQIDLYSLGANSYLDITSTIVNAGSSLTSPIIYSGLGTDDETNTNAGIYINNNGKMVARRNTTPLFLHRTDGGVGPLRATTFYSGGVFAGGINMFTNQAAQFVNPSDYRLKENIQDYNNASEIVKKARLRKFNFKNDPDTDVVGFIAHEYAEVNPNFVIGEKDAVDENGDPIYQEMMMGSITPYLIGALKESILKIEQLEARLDALEG